MKFLDKILSFIKSIFNKSEEVKKLQVSSQNINTKKKVDFIEEYKKEIVTTKRKNRVETLVCEGDGLGIQSKISY